MGEKRMNNKLKNIDFCKKCPEEIFKPNCDLNFPCPYYMDDELIKIEEEDGL